MTQVPDLQLWIQGVTTGVTTVIAVAALLLSIYNTRQQRRRYLRVEGRVRAAAPTATMDLSEKISLDIEVTNESQAAVTVKDIYARFPGEDTPTGFGSYARSERGDHPPCRLQPEDTIKFSVAWDTVERSVPAPDQDGWVRFTIGARDALSKHYEAEVAYR
jgi:hypothetical protein